MTDVHEYVEVKKADNELADDTLRTRENYLNKIDRWFNKNLDKQIEDITVEDTVKFFEHYLKPKWRKDTEKKIIRDEKGQFKKVETEGMTTDTARIYLNTIESFLDEKLGILEREEQEFNKYFKQMKDELPDSDYNKKMAQETPSVFKRDELEQIMEAADFKYELIYKLMLDSGRRPKEVASIKVDEVDFEENAIRYDILKKSLPTKRQIFIDDNLMDMLKRYIMEEVDDNDEYVFATRSKQGFLTTSSMNKAFRRHAEAAGVDLGDKSLKNLRHTYVTFRRKAGDTFASISQAGTQNTVQVMEKSYSGGATQEESRSGMGMLEDDES